MTPCRFPLPLPLALAGILVLGAAAAARPSMDAAESAHHHAARSDRDVPDGVWTRAGDDDAPPDDAPRDLVGADNPISPFLLDHTDARAMVTGPVAHTVVVQEWRNPNRDPVDGLYIFPLPDNAAVTAMSLRVGRRVIEAEMRRREEARAAYEQARAEGRIAGLLDQERPNIFAQRVANITPGTAVEVTLEFDQEVRCDDGACSYILPTVVGPRFIPDRQTDPGAIAPPVSAPGFPTGQTLSFTLDLDAGIPAHDVESPSHTMRIDTTRSGRATAILTDGRARLDRDIEVRWRLGGRDPEFGVLAYRSASDPGVFALYVQPPAGSDDPGLAAPRELVFLLDCSGSMSGAPLEAAKGVVRRALGAARPQDTLQILRFSDSASGLWNDPVPATPANVRRALAYLDTLRGEGGTQMLAGVRAALDHPADPERLRIVAFLTDGYIGNEDESLGEVRRLVGDARLFSFGIGSAVNRYLLEDLAQEGRGAAAFLRPGETPDDLVRRFTDRIATPVFTDIRLSWEGLDVDDQEPALVPDLFAGQPLVIHGRYRRPGAGALVLEGRLRGRREVMRRTVTLPAYAADSEALGRLWARARVDRLTRESYGRPHPDTVAAITDLGMRFHLMTPYTSLVAVDSLVSNRGGSQSVDVPVEMPAGVSYEGIFGHSEGQVAARAAGFAGNAGPTGAPAADVLSRLRSLGYVGSPAQSAAPPPGPAPLPPPAKSDHRTGHEYDSAAGAPHAGREPKDEPGRRDPSATGSVAGAAAGGVAGASPDDDAAPAFLQVVLIEEDGTRRTIESDGEAWLADTTTRRLARTLTAERLEDLRSALAAAGVDRWQAGEATWARGRSRLVVVSPGGMTHSVALPSGAPAIRALAEFVRAATS